jgi:hypothetical protein
MREDFNTWTWHPCAVSSIHVHDFPHASSLKLSLTARPQKEAWPHAGHLHFSKAVRTLEYERLARPAWNTPWWPPRDCRFIPCRSWYPVSPTHPISTILKQPQEICTHPANPLLAGMVTGGSLGVLHNYDFDSFKSLFQKNNGPQTDSREPLRGEHSQRNGPCGHNVGIPLHHLNGPMVFCSQTSVALEFQR